MYHCNTNILISQYITMTFRIYCLSSMRNFFACSCQLLILLVLGRPAARAQVPSWQTVVGIVPTTGENSRVSATAVDVAGNIIVVGEFSGTVSFGATTLTSAGYLDAFVAKWSPGSGSFIWAYRAGGTFGDEARAVAINGK